MSSCFRKMAVCWCVAVAGFSVASAQTNITPQGIQYGITGALPGDQSFPHSAIGASGGYVVWQDNAVNPLGLRIRARRLTAGFTPIGDPIVVSSAVKSKTAGEQEKPQVALLPDGGAVVVWQGGKLGLQQIYARILDASGVPQKSDIRVSNATKLNQSNPAVTVLANGSVAVVWSSFGQDGSRLGVFCQLLTSTGSKIGTEFQVNQFFLNNQRTPSVAGLADGNFAVLWVSELQRNAMSSVDIYGRIFSPEGAAVGSEFPVSVSTSNACANPVAAGLGDGGFAVAWSQRDDAGFALGGVVEGSASSMSSNGWDVVGCVLEANGAPRVAPFFLNTTRYGDQYVPRLASAGGNVLAVWTSLGQDGSREGIFGISFSAAGILDGPEFQVNTTTISRQIQPCVASDGEGHFLTIWSSFAAGTGFDLFAQTYITSQ